MSDQAVPLNRRQFLKTAVRASALLAAPLVIPGRVLGKDGAVSPSNQITLGAIGIGNRGGYVFQCFLQEPDIRCLAVCDVKADRRQRAKQATDARNGNPDCVTYRDLRELLARTDIDAVMIATGPNWHGTASMLAARYGKDVYCEKPCAKNIVECLALAAAFRRSGGVYQAGTQRRSLPNFMYCIELARTGRLGKLKTVTAHPGGLGTGMSGWAAPEPEPDKEMVDWDLYLGPAAWRPFNKAHLHGFGFEKGGGLTGGGCLEWGSHCVDLCQWAADADGTAAIEYEPANDELHAKYASGVKLVMRNGGWLNSGSCPVKFEGEDAWVETGDNGEIFTDKPALLAGRRQKVAGYPANFHVRNFLDCVKSRSLPRANADAACWSHITCNSANVSLALKKKIVLDPKTCMFVNDPVANRFRSEAIRDPWRI